MGLIDSLISGGGNPNPATPAPSSSLDPQYLDAIKGFEGYQPNASWDYKQYSSGYGTKAQPGDENLPPDQRQSVYEQRFHDEVGNAANAVDSFAPNLPPGVRAALTSLTYNAGPGWQQSGLGQAIKSGDFDKAQQLFLQYNKAGGEVNPGLVARRQKEAAWFGTGLPAHQQTASASPAIPANGIPAAAAPTFAQAGQQAPQQAAPQEFAAQQPNAGQSLFAQMPAQMTPLQPQFARPHQIDLSKLRAQLARAPIFSRG